ncbi:Coatomer beta subunit [Trema orientale]|uniref:Coatomer beta subunit n=1 Tax=Trema orientale TaxID=63057 RepID=A0A2P5BCD8_TREOI|nr:Coatomer beta subunit [Trema orientale]
MVACIALNECITCIRGPRRSQLLNVVSSNSVYLSQDPSGSYVVQQVLGLQNPLVNQKIICTQLKGQYGRFSFQKGASHVVEKCLDTPLMEVVVDELLSYIKLGQLAGHPYGNYAKRL